MIIHIYLDEKTEKEMKRAARELGRSIEELAERAVSEAALTYSKTRFKNSDPE